MNVGLRKALDLFSNLRPVRNLPGVEQPLRERRPDHRPREHRGPVRRARARDRPGHRREHQDHHRAASTRIARFAFEYARTHGRKRVTAIHKANIMKLSDGLFLESCRNVSREFIDITYDERIVDAACMHLVMHPEQLDVLLLPNLYGDIVSDLCAGLVGGLGVVPGANLGTEIGVFEAVHGSAPDIADQNLANPDGAAAVGPDDARAHRRAGARGADSRGADDGARRRARSGRAIWAAPRRRPSSPTRSAASSKRAEGRGQRPRAAGAAIHSPTLPPDACRPAPALVVRLI